ncbi:hypothetical protein QCO44_09345 [Selenomonas sputigena]|uniref:Uncharacterized protein n=1 Tax=Selenomonas sputigena TaxID=69823 RepID=A0ABV3X6K7_9FIRM
MDIKRYQQMKMGELREQPKEVLQELARLKQKNGNASALARKAQGILFCVNGCQFTRSHNPSNTHRDARRHGMGHN